MKLETMARIALFAPLCVLPACGDAPAFSAFAQDDASARTAAHPARRHIVAMTVDDSALDERPNLHGFGAGIRPGTGASGIVP